MNEQSKLPDLATHPGRPAVSDSPLIVSKRQNSRAVTHPLHFVQPQLYGEASLNVVVSDLSTSRYKYRVSTEGRGKNRRKTERKKPVTSPLWVCKMKDLSI